MAASAAYSEPRSRVLSARPLRVAPVRARSTSSLTFPQIMTTSFIVRYDLDIKRLARIHPHLAKLFEDLL